MNKPHESVTRSARYEFLDALRGIAILAVMLLHFGEHGGDSGDTLIHERVWPVVQHGYLGVQLFFVISGYCITAAAYGASRKTNPVRHFMTRRIRRILPPYWASLLLVTALGLLSVMIMNSPWDTMFPYTPGEWICNILLIQEPMQARAANMVYWSLTIELQFYLVIAAGLFFPKYKEQWLIAVTLLFMAADHLTRFQFAGYVLSYWSQFLCGIIVFYVLTRQMQWTWTPLVLSTLLLIDVGLHARGYETIYQHSGRFVLPIKILFCMCCAAGLIALRPLDEKITRLRPVRVLTWFGLISYSLYLIHVPVGMRVFNLTHRLTGLNGLNWLWASIAATALCTGFGLVFFRLFEKPWLNSAAVKKEERDTADPLQPVHEGIVT